MGEGIPRIGSGAGELHIVRCHPSGSCGAWCVYGRIAIGGRAGAVGGVIVVLLELGPLEHRRVVAHVEHSGGWFEDRTRGRAAKQPHVSWVSDHERRR